MKAFRKLFGEEDINLIPGRGGDSPVSIGSILFGWGLNAIYILQYEQQTIIWKEDTMEEITIGNRVKLARVEAGLTQQELAERAGVTRQTVVSLEAGRYVPSLELAMRLAHVFGRGVDDVFFVDDYEFELPAEIPPTLAGEMGA